MPEQDRLEVLEEQLAEDGFAPETLRALELILEELHYLRDELGDVHASSRTCRSTTPSHGAVAESERLFAAADAGPRQPLGTCGWDGRTDPSYNTSFHQGQHPYRTTCVNWRPLSPPVPQEAARCPKCGSNNPGNGGAFCGDKFHTVATTATDWAMRVAEQITQSGYLRTADIAALIREAGSERERAIPPIEYQHDIAKNIAKQHGFDPRDASFARCVGAVMQAWRAGGK